MKTLNLLNNSSQVWSILFMKSKITNVSQRALQTIQHTPLLSLDPSFGYGKTPPKSLKTLKRDKPQEEKSNRREESLKQDRQTCNKCLIYKVGRKSSSVITTWKNRMTVLKVNKVQMWKIWIREDVSQLQLSTGGIWTSVKTCARATWKIS